MRNLSDSRHGTIDETWVKGQIIQSTRPVYHPGQDQTVSCLRCVGCELLRGFKISHGFLNSSLDTQVTIFAENLASRSCQWPYRHSRPAGMSTVNWCDGTVSVTMDVVVRLWAHDRRGHAAIVMLQPGHGKLVHKMKMHYFRDLIVIAWSRQQLYHFTEIVKKNVHCAHVAYSSTIDWLHEK